MKPMWPKQELNSRLWLWPAPSRFLTTGFNFLARPCWPGVWGPLRLLLESRPYRICCYGWGSGADGFVMVYNSPSRRPQGHQ